MTKFKTLHIKPETWCRLNKIRSQLILAGLPHTFDDAVNFLLECKKLEGDEDEIL